MQTCRFSTFTTCAEMGSKIGCYSACCYLSKSQHLCFVYRIKTLSVTSKTHTGRGKGKYIFLNAHFFFFFFFVSYFGLKLCIQYLPLKYNNAVL